jgi:uncharacterized damage-inducible protein DinB
MMRRRIYDVAPVQGMHGEIAVLAAQLVDGTREWREELGDAEPGTVVWQPYPGAHSIGALILHMADVEGYWIEDMAAGRARPEEELRQLLSEETRQYGGEWPSPPVRPLAWYFEVQDRVRRRTMETLRDLADPSRVVRRENRDYGLTVRWIVAHVVQHEAYHGGQAVLLSIMKDRLNASAPGGH